MTMTPPPIMTLSEPAIERVRDLMNNRETPALGIRISLKTKGCNGLAYTLEFVEEKYPMDEEITAQDMSIFIDPKAVLYLIGTQMDYVEEAAHSGFVFKNPNEKGKCNCGKSFHV